MLSTATAQIAGAQNNPAPNRACDMRAGLLEVGREIDEVKKKYITHSNDFIRIFLANLSISVAHQLHQSSLSKI